MSCYAYENLVIMAKVFSLKVQNYRNIEKFYGEFNSSLNIFLGKNGQGKTNLMEAIFFPINGRVFREGTWNEFKKIGLSKEELCYSSIKIDHDNFRSHLSTHFDENKKEMIFNEKKTSQREIRKILHAILFCPQSLEVIRSSGESRRNLIDDVIVTNNLNNFKILQNFKKSLKQRNQYLRKVKEGKKKLNSTEKKYFNSLTEILIHHSVELAKLRIESLQKILPIQQFFLRKISSNSQMNLNIRYLVDKKDCFLKVETIKDAMRNKGLEVEPLEWVTGKSFLGAQKHDINFELNDKDSRYYCSQGEQRAIMIAFKVAEGYLYKEKFGAWPILFLDDVMSELDLGKKKCLIEILNMLETQIFITTTEIENLKNIQANKKSSVFTITNGKVLEENKIPEVFSV